MKQRILEILKELKETHTEFIQSQPENLRGFLVLDYNTLFSEAVSCYRGEQAGKNSYKKSYIKKEEPMSDKQRNYIENNKNLLITSGFDLENIQYKSQASKIISEFINLNNATKTKNK